MGFRDAYAVEHSKLLTTHAVNFGIKEPGSSAARLLRLRACAVWGHREACTRPENRAAAPPTIDY